jgi:hypothetical protein
MNVKCSGCLAETVVDNVLSEPSLTDDGFYYATTIVPCTCGANLFVTARVEEVDNAWRISDEQPYRV